MYLPGQPVVNPIEIIAEFYGPGSMAYKLLLRHGRQVAQKHFRPQPGCRI